MTDLELLELAAKAAGLTLGPGVEPDERRDPGQRHGLW